MPFGNGNRVHLPSAELRVISAHDDGLHIEIRPSDGPIGGISIFLSASSFPALLRGIADSMRHVDGDDPPPDSTTEKTEKQLDTEDDGEGNPAENAAAEIWLRAELPRQANERADDVLDAPSFWQRFRDRR